MKETVELNMKDKYEKTYEIIFRYLAHFSCSYLLKIIL